MNFGCTHTMCHTKVMVIKMMLFLKRLHIYRHIYNAVTASVVNFNDRYMVTVHITFLGIIWLTKIDNLWGYRYSYKRYLSGDDIYAKSSVRTDLTNQ